MFTLYDTFNKQIISKHRTMENAIKADKKLQKSIKHHNGDTSYIPTVIKDSNWKNVDTYQ